MLWMALLACFPAWDLGPNDPQADFDGDGVANADDCAPTDDALPISGYPDADGDGFRSSTLTEGCGPLLDTGAEIDCDDTDAARYPSNSDPCWQPEDRDCDEFTEQCHTSGEVTFGVTPDENGLLGFEQAGVKKVVALGNMDPPSADTLGTAEIGILREGGYLEVIHRTGDDVFETAILMPPTGEGGFLDVAGLGDINADGIADIGLVFQGEDSPLEILIPIAPLAGDLGTLGEDVPYFQFDLPDDIEEVVLAGIGNVDQDGSSSIEYADFALGFPSTGEVWVLLGGEVFQGEAGPLECESDLRCTKIAASDDTGFGTEVVGVGDLTGDGYGEFTVATERGSVARLYVLEGHPSAWSENEMSDPKDPEELSYTILEHSQGLDQGDGIMRARFLGDLLGDDYVADLGVTVNGSWYLFTTSGDTPLEPLSAQSLSNSPYVLRFGGPADGLGIDWAGLNADGDDYPDLAITDPLHGNEGDVWLLAGEKLRTMADNWPPGDGVAEYYPYWDGLDWNFDPNPTDTLETDPFLRIVEENAGYQMPDLVVLGDVSDDAIDDLAVGGAPGGDASNGLVSPNEYRFYFMGYGP